MIFTHSLLIIPFQAVFEIQFNFALNFKRFFMRSNSLAQNISLFANLDIKKEIVAFILISHQNTAPALAFFVNKRLHVRYIFFIIGNIILDSLVDVLVVIII